MKRFFDKFLWGILWLLSITLVTTLWMNVNYGFDMLSAAHWEYLGTLQAHRSEIKPDFYISLIGALVIALVGLYIIVRPREKQTKIMLPAIAPTGTVQTQPVVQQPKPAPKPEPTQETESKPEKTFSPRPAPAISLSARPMSPMGLRQHTQHQSAPTQPIPIPKLQIQQPKAESKNSSEIKQTLESNEYIIKKCERIGKLQNPVVAIAYDQRLWIIANDTTPDNMVDAIQTLVTVFDDTLGETANDIKITGFIIGPTATNQRNDNLVMTFDNLTDFVKYVEEHKNKKPEDYDAELFEAFSTYIGTVTGYIGKA